MSERAGCLCRVGCDDNVRLEIFWSAFKFTSPICLGAEKMELGIPELWERMQMSARIMSGETILFIQDAERIISDMNLSFVSCTRSTLQLIDEKKKVVVTQGLLHLTPFLRSSQLNFYQVRNLCVDLELDVITPPPVTRAHGHCSLLLSLLTYYHSFPML